MNNKLRIFKTDTVLLWAHTIKPVCLPVVMSLFMTSLNPAFAQEDSMQLKLMLGDVSLNKLPFVLAYDEGIYEKNGLDLIPMFTQSSVNIIRRSGIDVPEEFILKGDEVTPIRIGGASPTIVRLTTKAGAWNPVILGSTHLRSRWHIVSGTDISSAEDLKGKRIGFSGVGAVTHLAAISFARAMGWDPNLDWSMMADGLAVEALQNDHIDAFVADNLHGTMAVGAGFKELVDLADYDFPVAGSSFLVDREWLKNNPEAARRFIKSAVEAIALLKNNKQAAFRSLGKWYQMHDPELLEHFYSAVERMPRKPYPPVEGLKKVMEIYDSHEMRKYTLTHFYDDSFVRELDESGYIDSLYQ